LQNVNREPPKILSLLLLALVAILPSFTVHPTISHSEQWITLSEPVRVTFYGPEYKAGAITASGIRYAPCNDIVALGPSLLEAVREHYARESIKVGYYDADAWVITRRHSFVSVAGGFPVWPCTECTPDWWGYLVRICDPITNYCQIARVADTGRPGLDIDLPDETWLKFGYPLAQGVFTGTLQVLKIE
jgi:hypothetical protein